jgi:hypothetical protein
VAVLRFSALLEECPGPQGMSVEGAASGPSGSAGFGTGILVALAGAAGWVLHMLFTDS